MAPSIPINYTGLRESKKFSKRSSGDLMGKTRKVSKGNSIGFVPDFRHAVETVAESEGFGNSGRGDVEVTASQDPCAPNRKCIGLNVGFNRSFVPINHVCLSKMSPLERRDLGIRLRSELEKVTKLQREIDSFALNAIAHPPANIEVHTYQYGPKGGHAVMENLPLSTNDELMVSRKKKCPSGRNGPRTKGGPATANRNGSVKQSLTQNTGFVMLMKQCDTLLTRLMAHPQSWVFNEPVDIVKHNIPDYFDVIKHPMDLGTIQSKLLTNQYSNPKDFAADVRLTFKNAMTYNPIGHAVHIMADTMGKFFEMRWKPIEKKILSMVDSSTASKSGVIETESAYLPPTKKQKTTSVENNVKREKDKRVMSDDEKQKLGADLEELLAELPDNIISFLKESSSNCSQVSEDEIEIEIDTFSDENLFTLRKLLDDLLLEKHKKQTTLEPCKIEMQKEPGFNSSSIQPCTDNEPADDDVDIGINDPPPASSCPPVKTDEIVTQRNNKCSSSRSSDNVLGSSSSAFLCYATDPNTVGIKVQIMKKKLRCSLRAQILLKRDYPGLCFLKRDKKLTSNYTDSGSSASELDGDKNSVLASTVTGIADSKIKQKECDQRDPSLGDFLNGNGEQHTELNPSSVEPHCHREGESTPQERQVSPDKLYRAALLRGRFADIIIKAQENSIEKGERPDPEKLKRERDEIERRRKEEKARLQAEAKAAEAARKKAEVEAAAEAKRKRELEREAARQALLKMEKTVEINESSQFMEDLEMFRSAQDEPLQSFMEAASPENSINGLGSFKFQASSNPLEQLGLYMKNDEEEEEIDPQSNLDALNDPEEGEID
ncbi:hypothetical protein OROMI_033733 [Orobanche minor]